MVERRSGPGGPADDPEHAAVAAVLQALLVPRSHDDLAREVQPRDPVALLRLVDRLVEAGFARTVEREAGRGPLVQALAEGLAHHAAPVFPLCDETGLVIGWARVTSAVGDVFVDPSGASAIQAETPA